MTPRLVRTREELAAARGALQGRVAVVLTMGALHAGHAELVRRARAVADSVVVTVFVNPLQFGPSEDLARYPRTLEADLELCARERVDVVLAPDVATVYPDGEPSVRVSAGALGELLEGRSRPGHFDGVLTVVLKLFHLTRPDVAVFGCKDAQQLLLVRRMVRDLDLPVDVVGVPTVREDDGLALSSRNAYLSSGQRATALTLSRSLVAAATAAAGGAAAVRRATRQVLEAERDLVVDYVALTDPDTLSEVEDSYTGEALLLVAARVGRARLIDNATVVVGAP